MRNRTEVLLFTSLTLTARPNRFTDYHEPVEIVCIAAAPVQDLRCPNEHELLFQLIPFTIRCLIDQLRCRCKRADQLFHVPRVFVHGVLASL